MVYFIKAPTPMIEIEYLIFYILCIEGHNMSSVLDNKVAKEKCQKFTPSDLVQTMLNLAGYTCRLAGHPILENSFGSGNILTTIVKRYIDSCLAEGMARDTISKGLSRD